MAAISNEFWLGLALTGIPGMLGGATYGVSAYLQAVKAKETDWPPCGHLKSSAFFLANAVSGFGGAIAALLVTLWAKRFPDQPGELESAKGALILACTGFVAGYAANKLLPAIAEALYQKMTKLAERVQENEAKVDEAHQRIESAETLAARAVQMATELVRTKDYLAEKNFSQRSKTEDQVRTLSDLATLFPTNRTLHILLARLHDEALQDRKSAIADLQRYLKAKEAAGQSKDIDFADVNWNLANYFEWQYRDTHDAHWRTDAINALRTSIRLSPSGYDALLKDDDFKDLRESPEGKALLGELGHDDGQGRPKPAPGGMN